MNRIIAFLLLVIASSSSGDSIQPAGAVAAHSSSFIRTPPLSIDASTPTIADRYANANADGNNTTNATTASPAKALAPSPAPAPTIPPTSAPSKKYVSPDDGGDESEAGKIEREIPMIATVFFWVAIAFASIWLVCYFRDAIIFFFGNVRRRHESCIRCYFPHHPTIAHSLSARHSFSSTRHTRRHGPTPADTAARDVSDPSSLARGDCGREGGDREKRLLIRSYSSPTTTPLPSCLRGWTGEIYTTKMLMVLVLFRR